MHRTVLKARRAYQHGSIDEQKCINLQTDCKNTFLINVSISDHMFIAERCDRSKTLLCSAVDCVHVCDLAKIFIWKLCLMRIFRFVDPNRRLLGLVLTEMSVFSSKLGFLPRSREESSTWTQKILCQLSSLDSVPLEESALGICHHSFSLVSISSSRLSWGQVVSTHNFLFWSLL